MVKVECLREETRYLDTEKQGLSKGSYALETEMVLRVDGNVLTASVHSFKCVRTGEMNTNVSADNRNGYVVAPIITKLNSISDLESALELHIVLVGILRVMGPLKLNRLSHTGHDYLQLYQNLQKQSEKKSE